MSRRKRENEARVTVIGFINIHANLYIDERYDDTDSKKVKRDRKRKALVKFRIERIE